VRSILFCNEMLGLGHLRRSLAIAGELARIEDGSTALVATGSPAFGGLPVPAGVDILKLPTAAVDGDSGWSATDLRPTVGLALEAAEVTALRSELAGAALATMRPDVVLVDHKPLGRSEELRGPLARCRADGGCTVALGIWEVDDRPEMLTDQWTYELVDEIARLYDVVLVYGEPDPRDIRIERLTRAGLTIHRTGLVGSPLAERPAADLGSGYLLVSVGGGADGLPVLEAVVDSVRASPPACRVVVVTGPLMADREVQTLRERASGLDVRIERSRADMEAVLAGARAVVAMAGYCTVAEILGSGAPALLVPRAFPRTEQLNRARRLEAAGRVEVLGSDQLAPDELADAIGRLLERGPVAPAALTGAVDAARILARSRAYA
jgi:predicted glycosyltransferase